MVFNYKLVLLWAVCLLLKVALIRCKVTSVHRNVTDSFRVGEDGCKANTDCSPSTTSSATCQSDTGVCLCKDNQSNFLNYTTNFGNVYGCIISSDIQTGFGECL